MLQDELQVSLKPSNII